MGCVDKNKILNLPLFRLSSVSTLKEISFSKDHIILKSKLFSAKSHPKMQEIAIAEL